MKRFSFKLLELDNISDEEFNSFKTKSIFTTKEWIRFVAEDSKAAPVIAGIYDRDMQIGFFSGLSIRKFGVKIVASPFNGWSTCYMGLDIIDGYDKMEIVRELQNFLFKACRCAYVEIIDRDITMDMARTAGFKCAPVSTLELKIGKTDEELLKGFKHTCRNFINQFQKRGASLEIAEPNDEFAEEFYNQVKAVFAKQHLVPTYTLEKVKTLMRHLAKTEMILCLRIRNPDGKSIATSIFLGYNKKLYFWGCASYRTELCYRPIEYMIWNAIRYWRDRGIEMFDMVGVRDYKRKFGTHEEEYARLTLARFRILIPMRNCAQFLFFLMLKIKGRIRSFIGQERTSISEQV